MQKIDKKVYDFVNEAEKKIAGELARVDAIALANQAKVLDAFHEYNIGQRHFAQTNGYGYDDIGRDSLANVFAYAFGAESAVVSPQIVSGTHALTAALFGLLRPGDVLLSVSGEPYDTLKEAITGKGTGSLADYGVIYDSVPLKEGKLDFDAIKHAFGNHSRIKVVFVGRSRGYEWRDALSVEEIGCMCKFVKSLQGDVIVMCDNCYGEFVDTIEPVAVGVDIMAGSLIKNPGGGIAPTGGYICGKKALVEQATYRLTSPSIGGEVGSYAYGYREFYQGFFLAPHVTAQAIKTSMLFGAAFDMLGYDTMPKPGAICRDIIRSIKFNTEEELTAFVRAIQYASPVDGNVTPFAWDMPGYEDQVIMAAGTFVAGASIELSADSPIRKPYIAYLQGGLTYEHGKIALAGCLQGLGLIK